MLVDIFIVDPDDTEANRPFVKIDAGGGNIFRFDLPSGDCDQWDNSDAPYNAGASTDFLDCDMSGVTCKLTSIPDVPF